MAPDASLTRQQPLLLAEQQVLQVQAARLELQQQQLEIEQLVEQQQQQLQVAVGQWPAAQQQQQQQQHTPGAPARQPLGAGAGFMAYHGQGSLQASQVHGLQQAASIASTASGGSPTHAGAHLKLTQVQVLWELLPTSRGMACLTLPQGPLLSPACTHLLAALQCRPAPQAPAACHLGLHCPGAPRGQPGGASGSQHGPLVGSNGGGRQQWRSRRAAV